MSMNKYKAAVIGLGNIGFQLQLDPKRTQIWSHCHAYDRCENTELIAAVEIDPAKAAQFNKAFPGIPVYSGLLEMFADQKPDIVSICTPTASHENLFIELAQSDVKAIFAEKPFAADRAAAERCFQAGREKGIVTALNHNRRWNGLFRQASAIVREDGIGKIKSVHAYYPGQVYNIGTHLFDSLRMLLGQNPVAASGIIAPSAQTGDPSISGVILFTNDIFCSIAATGKREDLVMEIDIMGSEGRIQILQNGFELKLFRFKDSSRYSGYRELVEADIHRVDHGDPLLDAVYEITAVLEGKMEAPSCTALDGYWTMALVDAMLESAERNGEFKTLAGPPA